MSKMNLRRNDDITILSLGDHDYIAVVNNSSSPYTKYPEDKSVDPIETLWMVTEDESVNVDVNDNIEDGFTNFFARIVGPRPKNIYKR